jgi:hypothetical protein
MRGSIIERLFMCLRKLDIWKETLTQCTEVDASREQKGKKAKRKAREKQLEEARRLASLREFSLCALSSPMRACDHTTAHVKSFCWFSWIVACDWLAASMHAYVQKRTLNS